MKVSDILERRQENWQELARLTARLETARRSKIAAAEIARFGSLYRAACADLALADAYQLPPNVVQYLHRLVGRAHNQLYRARRFNFARWRKILLEDVPQHIFHDRCVQLAFALFWGMFLFCAALGYYSREFTETLIGPQMLSRMQEMHGNTPGSGSPITSPLATAFYIQHNTSIGLECFAGGLLVTPGVVITIFNAGYLGAVFGFMARPEVEESKNFFNFVTAHGPFELTAIVLSAGAGLRLGMSWINGREQPISSDDAELDSDAAASFKLYLASGIRHIVLSRTAKLKLAAKKAMPIMGAAILMFFMAALVEGFLSPSAAPYWCKAGVAVASSIFLAFYFIVLGFPKK